MDWIKATLQVFILTVRPLRSVKAIWGWVDVVILLLVLVGVLAAGLRISNMAWLATTVLPSVIAILVLIAAIRLQRRMARMQGPLGVKAGDTVKGKDFNLSLFLQDQRNHRIANVTFDRCILRGPCLVAVLGSIELVGSGFRGGQQPDDLIIEVTETRRMAGIATLVHCKFNYCEFHSISWMLEKPLADKLRAMVKV